MESIYVKARTLPEAWEQAVRECWEKGARFRTQYDKPDDPESRDVACLIHVAEPFAEPRIHKAFPGGLEDLEVYRAEVLYGVHDHWIAPEEGKWEYTYHERLRAYKVPGREEPIDQIAEVVRMLKETPYTRRAQAVTWQAWNDLGIRDPACLQRMWFRVEEAPNPNGAGGAGPAGQGREGRASRLNLAIHIRSNDAFKAAFMNMYAFTELQREVARELGVEPGEYVHVADSFHIYGSYFAEFEGFLRLLEKRPDRYYTTAFARPVFEDGARRVLAEADLPAEARSAVQKRLAELGSGSEE
ncbi:MAG TPA: thymidylate synthase [Phycisphaerae bacterium]|nr:thymidylate synthase [Phycisphaerae bacterium]